MELKRNTVKTVIFLLFTLSFSLFGQKISLSVNDKVIDNVNISNIQLQPTDKILLIMKTYNQVLADLDFSLFLNGKEFNYELASEKVAHFPIGTLEKGTHIFKIVYRIADSTKQVIYRFNISDQNEPVKKKPEPKKIIEPVKSQDSSAEIFNPVTIGLIVLVLVLLIVILILLKGKGKIKEESNVELEGFNKQIIDLESAFNTCKKNTERLHNKNKKLIEEINSLESNIKELEEINSILIDQKEKLVAKKTQLEELQKQKDELFAMAVHDIKNPASVIQSLIQLMESYDLTATEQSEIMQTLIESTANIIKLSKEMSEVIARQKDSGMIEKEPASIKEVIDSVVSLNTTYAKRKQIKLLNHSSDSIPNINMDASKIKEVLDNLVNNAIKYGPEKTVVEVKAYFSETKITVEVSDTGVGLSEHDLKIMFAKGMTLSTKPTGGEHSSGLGLWLSKKIVEEHGGKIWAKSKLGVGTKFYFELPIE